MNIKINLKIFLFISIFILTNKIKIFSLLMIFALIHELGHLFCGIALKMKPNTINIAPYGFSLSFKVNYNDYNKKVKKGNLICIKRMIIAFAGPFVNLILAIMYINTSKEIAYSNLILFVFNMIPIYPLDGGRIVKEMIHIFKGKMKSYKYTKTLSLWSIAIVTALIVFLITQYKNIFLIIVLIYLWSIMIKTKKEIDLKEKIYRKIR